MPSLEKIVIQDWRNIALQEVSFSPNVNCISGGNGEGKTNLLDAIWYLSMTKSANGSSDKFNFRHGCDSFSLLGTYSMESGLSSKFSLQAFSSSGEKKVKRDDKPYPRVSDHIGTLPIVMVSPSDTAMVSDSGEQRRRFANMVLSQMQKDYLSTLQQYNRLLQQRNRLLKAGIVDEDLLCAFDCRLSSLAVPIYESRSRFSTELLPIVQQFYENISGGKESVKIEYRSDLQRESLEESLRRCRERDRVFRFTTAGVQRDDFVFTMDEHPLRHCGSQGQQKSFIVALKFAQYEVMRRAYGFPPILLLDDLFDKLDLGRVSSLLKMVSSNEFGQIFITDSNKVRTEGIVASITSQRCFIKAEGGAFTKVDD